MKTRRRILGVSLAAVVAVAAFRCCTRSREIPMEYLPGASVHSGGGDVFRQLPKNINFLGVPDGESVQKQISADPRIEVEVVSRVMRTEMDLYRLFCATNPPVQAQRVGKYQYFAETRNDAYVFPDSSKEKPHGIPYQRTERFVAYDYAPDEIRASEAERKRFFRGLHLAYKQASARLEFERALALGDRRLVGVMGIGLIIPASSSVDQNEMDRFGWKIVPGTSDYYRSNDEKEFNEIAQQFAKEYNDMLLRKLRAE